MLLATIALPATVQAASSTPLVRGVPSLDTIFRRAELARNPFLGVGVDLELRVLSQETGRELRRSSYLLLTHRMDRSLLVMQQPDPAHPGALLIADDTYWLLLPKAEQPVELALRHVVAGDLSHAGFLRVNLRIRYEPRLVGETTIDGEACWQLELLPREQAAPFGRVLYWVAKEPLRPTRIEYYAPTGALLKTVRFLSYRNTGIGMAPERIEIEDASRTSERSILLLSAPTRVDTYMLNFDVRELFLLREAARRLGAAASLGAAELVDALRSAEPAGEAVASP